MLLKFERAGNPLAVLRVKSVPFDRSSFRRNIETLGDIGNRSTSSEVSGSVE